MFDAKIIDVDNIDYISSGIDFWGHSYVTCSMYFVNAFIKNNYNIEDFKNQSNIDLTDPFITDFILEDELDIEPDQDALKLLKQLIQSIDKEREQPFYKSLRIKENENRIQKYNSIKDLFDEIILT